MGSLKRTIACDQVEAATAKLTAFTRYGASWPVPLREKQRLHAALLERLTFWSAQVNRAR